jgi:hypothetical protein
MNPEDSHPPPGTLPLQAAMHEWLPEKVLAAVDAASDDLKLNARQVYWIDAQGREVVEIDPYSDFNRPLLLRMREAQAAAEAAFLAMLRAGRLIAWAREGSPVAPFRRIPADAWASLRLVHVTEGRASGHGVKLFGIHVAPATALQRASPSGEPKANDNAADAGRPPPDMTSTGARISGGRVAPASAPPEPGPPSGGTKQAYSPDALAAFFMLRVKTWPKDAPPPTENECIAAVRDYFADPPGRDVIREIRRQKTPESWRKRGPRSRR